MFIINEASQRVVKSVTRHFARLGWRVTETRRSEEPLLHVAKRDLVFLIKCVDTDIQRFLPVFELVDRMDTLGGEYWRRSGEGIVFVVNRPLNGLAADAVLSRGIALFALTDLDVLTDLELLYQNILAILSVRERLVIRGCKSFCIALSDAALNKGDYSAARMWLELNLDGVHVLLSTHYRLVDLLILEHDYDAARIVAMRALTVAPYNNIFLQKLRNIEVATNNIDALPGLDSRISSAFEVRPGLEAILANQRPGAGAIAGEVKSVPRREHIGTSVFKWLLKRVNGP